MPGQTRQAPVQFGEAGRFLFDKGVPLTFPYLCEFNQPWSGRRKWLAIFGACLSDLV
jgi:hypothetical protein